LIFFCRDKDNCEFPFKFKLAAEDGSRLLETYVGVYITVGVSKKRGFYDTRAKNFNTVSNTNQSNKLAVFDTFFYFFLSNSTKCR